MIFLLLSLRSILLSVKMLRWPLMLSIELFWNILMESWIRPLICSILSLILISMEEVIREGWLLCLDWRKSTSSKKTIASLSSSIKRFSQLLRPSQSRPESVWPTVSFTWKSTKWQKHASIEYWNSIQIVSKPILDWQ